MAERASGLQRWAVALSLEAARQQEAAKGLRDLESEVRPQIIVNTQYVELLVVCLHVATHFEAFQDDLRHTACNDWCTAIGELSSTLSFTAQEISTIYIVSLLQSY